MNPPRPSVRWVRLLLGAVLVFVALPFGFQHFRVRGEYSQAAATLETQRERARALNIPLEWKDLEPAIPPDQNAAPIYLQAIAKYKKLPPGTEEGLYLIGSTASAKGPDSLERCAEILPLLERAARRPHCIFERDLRRPYVAGGVWELKKFVKLACAQAFWDVHEGRMEAAIGWLRVAATMSRHVGEDPSVLGGLALEPIVWSSLQRVLDPAKMTMKHVAQARAAIGEMRGDPLRSMERELVFRLNIYEMLDEYFEQPSDGSWWQRILGSFGFAPGGAFHRGAFHPFAQDQKLVERAYQARVLSRWIPFLEAARAARGDPGRIAAAISGLEAAVKSGTHRIDEAERQFVDLDGLGEMYKHQVAQRRLALQALDVIEFRLRNGRLPTRLEEVGTPRLDPFDNKPLRYRPKGPAFVLYSIDRDGIDGGGGGGDLLFVVPKPP